MKAITELQEAGFSFTVDGEKVSYRWTKQEPPDPEKVFPLLAELKKNKDKARAYLLSRQKDCEACPAAGYWDGYVALGVSPGRYCFYEAYFLGRAAKPVKCANRQRDCPKKG